MTITINDLRQNIDLSKVFKYKVKSGDKILLEESFTHSPNKFFTKKVGNALHIIDENTLNDFAVLDNYFSNADNVHLFGFGENADLSSYLLNSSNDLLSLQSSESCLALATPIENAMAAQINPLLFSPVAALGAIPGGSSVSSTVAALDISMPTIIGNNGVVTIAGTTNLAAGSAIQITLTDSAGKTVAVSTTSLSDGTYTTNADLTGLSDGTIRAMATAIDDNGNTVTASDTGILDATAPTATITMSDSAIQIGNTAIITITFSEAIVGFSNDDVLVENGTVDTFTTTDGGITWSAIFTPINNIEDTTNVITLANTYEDMVGNAGTAVVSDNYIIDTIAPTATITMSDTTITKGETSTLTISFSEAVVGFDVNDVLVENGTIDTFTTTDGGITWSAILTPTDNIEDLTNTITLNPSSYTDIVGNAGDGAISENYTLNTIDNTPASADVFFLSSSTQQMGTNNFSVIAVFDEAVTDLTASDFKFTCQDGGGTLISSTLTQISDDTYQFDATYNLGGVNTTGIAFYLASNSYSDLYGNGGNYVISNALSTSSWW